MTAKSSSASARGALVATIALCLTLPLLGGGPVVAANSLHEAAQHRAVKKRAGRNFVGRRVLRKAKHRRPSKARPAVETVATPAIPLLSREQIFATDADRLTRVGRHVMVGYHLASDIRAMIDKNAIAGIFITDHNVRRRTVAAIRAEIDGFQELRKSKGMPLLIVAADQEGGAVSRLTPPLKRQASLATVLKGLPDDAARKSAVQKFATVQADELKRLGVTLNFAPVVDLNFNPTNRSDGETKLRFRTIGRDPHLVSKVAQWYCDALAESGILCTLKHFPGLGRVKLDTHKTSGEIGVTEGNLELNDWIPFRRLMKSPNAVTMIGHVRVSALDKKTPASYSNAVIGDLIRKRWDYNGVVITDDFSMGAVTRSAEGVGGAAVKSLQAGTDIVLVSYSEKHYDAVMSALIRADEEDAFDDSGRKASLERISKTQQSAPREPVP